MTSASSSPSPRADLAFQILLVLAAIFTVGTIQFIAFHTPTEATMGIV